jgi:sterol desaturase/sphingolipid hydroxylase (fatty acid hydroxylase superfamily)
MWTQYWVWLALISLAFVIIERLRPWRAQPLLRDGVGTDLAYLVFNGHILALLLAPIVVRLLPPIESVIVPYLGRAHASSLPLWAQVLIVFFAIDFIKWCVHVALHNFSFLWAFHRVHHSIVDMDWMGNMRFHWMEIVFYNSVLYLPTLLLGFDWRVVLGMAIFSTIMGHFNHSNLRIDVGPLKYLLNHPAMHIWHHDHVMHYRAGCNFGINLSLWDWIFRTAYMPKDVEQPTRLGFEGIEDFPKSFLTQQLVPLSTALKHRSA